MHATGQKVLTATVPLRIHGRVCGDIPSQLGLVRQRHTGLIGPLEDGWLEEPRMRPNRDATGHYLVEIGNVEKSVILYHESELTVVGSNGYIRDALTVPSNAAVALGMPGAEQA